MPCTITGDPGWILLYTVGLRCVCRRVNDPEPFWFWVSGVTIQRPH